MRVTAAWVLVVALAGCAGDSTPGKDVGSSSATRAPNRLSARSLIDLGRGPQYAIGVEDGGDDEIFGRIRGAVVGDSGDVLLLDYQALEVRWFDAHGRLQGRFGRKGSGPGEFRSPLSLTRAVDGSFRVVDGPLRKITTFAVRDHRLQLVSEIPTGERFGVAVCRNSAGYLLVAPSTSSTESLVQLDPHGVEADAFGGKLHELPAEVQKYGWDQSPLQNRGPIFCDERTGVAYFAHSELGYVRAFDSSHRELWRTQLADYSRVHWTPMSGGSLLGEMPDPETGFMDFANAVFPWGEDTVGVSIERIGWPRITPRYQLRLLDAETGAELAIVDMPMLVTEVKGGLVYGYVNDPYPRLLAYERAGRPTDDR